MHDEQGLPNLSMLYSLRDLSYLVKMTLHGNHLKKNQDDILFIVDLLGTIHKRRLL